MPDRLELSAFEPCLGDTFVLEVDGVGPVDVKLVEAEPSPWQAAPGSGFAHAYSLVFRGPPELVLGQRTYRMRHDGLGELDIFITPIGRTADGVDYQAVFS